LEACLDGAAVKVSVGHYEMSIFGELTHSNVRGAATFYFDRYQNLIDHKGPTLAVLGKMVMDARRYAARKGMFRRLRRLDVADFSA